MTWQRKDRGLKAVRRVRAVRERDSKIGLQQALAISRRRQDEAEEARDRLAAAAPFRRGNVAAFQLHMMLQRARVDEVVAKEEQASSSLTVAEEAKRRWIQDRQAVRTVELLLERRDEERQAERARREAADLDELAGQAWLRDQGEPATTVTTPEEHP